MDWNQIFKEKERLLKYKAVHWEEGKDISCDLGLLYIGFMLKLGGI